jgi:cytochrome c-type biogenesis protein CcmH
MNVQVVKQLAAIAFALLLLATPALAVSDPAELLPNHAQEHRAEIIGHQLRCLVCQNESVEDSDADLARDLRHIIRQRVVAGDSDSQVIDWMVARYGNFVRLRPPFNALTFLLWACPALAILVGAGCALVARRRRPAPPAPLTPAEQRKLTELLRS